MLKRLSQAQREGDTVMAIVRGSAVAQDGRGAWMTAPNASSQEGLLRTALNNAQVQPESIDYIETHGTGTPIGDSVEVEALGAVSARHERTPADVCSER